MNKTITLPDGMYRCTKMKSTNGYAPIVVEGQSEVGEYAPIIEVGECFYAEGQGLWSGIRTSLVKDFKLLPDNKVEIHTQNSIYLLEEISIDDTL